MDKNVVLLTGTIDPQNVPYVRIRQPWERLKDYVISILMWLLFSDASDIVFCENSNYNYNYQYLYEIASLKQKRLEIITFDGNKESEKFGKGYGEGLIIEYAIHNSRILKSVDNFYKVTGRLFVENFNIIVKYHEKDSTVFNKYGLRSKMVDTRFFKSSISFYKENLIDAYKEVNDLKRIYLEHVFYRRLNGKSIPSFKRYPRFVGRSGSNGIIYRNPKWKLFIEDIFQMLGMYKV